MKKPNQILHFVFIFILFCACINVWAQKQNNTYLSYISKYAEMAIDQMKRHGIPASITLAQGLLESAAGQSTLATQANNHFGIKTGGSWDGPYVLRDDDRANERFRKYSSVAESFEDHSLFLKKPRYARLFSLKLTDYKGWAKGLKECGYATSPTYAEKLIGIIELYTLYDFDNGKYSQTYNSANSQNNYSYCQNAQVTKIASHGDADFFASHPIAMNNKNYYIRILPGDDLKTISKSVDVSQRKLRRYNELIKGAPLVPGSILYLKSKRSHADRAFKRHPHIVESGESLYDIAQMYGMKLKSIYKFNKLPLDYQPQVGDQLRVY